MPQVGAAVNGFKREQLWHHRISRLRPQSLFACLCFLICAVLVSDYTLNHFYRTGAYFWDSGEFAYLTSFSTSWPMLLPPVFDQHVAFFTIHVMPIFYVTSALHQALSFIPAAAYFSLLQGVWVGLLGSAVFVACMRSDNLALAAITALATAFCGPVLSTIGFPHVEIAIPALLLLFLALRSTRHRIGAYVALGLCLLVREDAGVHAGLVLILLALAQRVSGDSWESVRENALIACICFGYSFAALAFQHFFYPAPLSRLKVVYLGDPIFSHLSWSLVGQRLIVLLTAKAYLTWPLIFLLTTAVWKRSVILAVGPIAVLPWILMSLLAASGYAGALASYYSFPIIVAIAWPSIAFSMKRARMNLQLFTSVLSIVLFVSLGRGNLGNAPWEGLSVPNFGAIGTYETALRNVINRRKEFGRLIVDDAVASLVPESLIRDEWLYQWSVDRLPNPDVVIYKDRAWDSASTERAVEASGLTHRCQIENTPFFVASREGTSRSCP
ncbi:MAG: hypothetical protein ABSF87_05855 [Xanthobacteraceae bacterium]|jgi:hypothetical protein